MQSPEQNPRFVFVQPKLDISKPQPKPNVDRSDQDRVKSTIEKPPDPQNAMPFARGNSRELEEADLAPPIAETHPRHPSRRELPRRTPKARWRPTIRHVR